VLFAPDLVSAPPRARVPKEVVHVDRRESHQPNPSPSISASNRSEVRSGAGSSG
jgi:hypothetical protein